MLEIKNVYKTYDKKKYAIEDVSLSVDKGDIFAFIGPNGAGKTTLIKCITGLIPFEKGEIYVDGKNVKEEIDSVKSDIAYIPDNPDIYESLTGIEFLNFIADAFKIKKEIRKEKIEYLSKYFNIYDNLTDLISSYSHGMKQKLVIISALIHSPKLLILDEPFVGLDPEASFKLKQIMSEYCQNGGSIFFSTHVLETAEKICNKIVIIKDGKIIKSGLTKDIIKDETLEDVFMELLKESRNG